VEIPGTDVRLCGNLISNHGRTCNHIVIYLFTVTLAPKNSFGACSSAMNLHCDAGGYKLHYT